MKNAKIIYKNWKGETAERSIAPIKIWFGSTKWHKSEQWFVKAMDIDKDQERDFALKDIKKWM